MTTALEAEIAALDAIRQALEPLEPLARSRVLRWADSRYSVTGDVGETLQKWLMSLMATVGEHVATIADPDEATPTEAKLIKALEGTRFALKVSS